MDNYKEDDLSIIYSNLDDIKSSFDFMNIYYDDLFKNQRGIKDCVEHGLIMNFEYWLRQLNHYISCDVQ